MNGMNDIPVYRYERYTAGNPGGLWRWESIKPSAQRVLKYIEYLLDEQSHNLFK